MEQYRYFVKDHKGESRSGIIEAINIKQACSLLHERGLIVIKLTPKQRGINVIELIENLRPIGLGELASFTRQLSTMISSGLPLVDTLNLLEKQSTNPKMKLALADVVRNIQGGGNLANAMAKHKGVFSTTYVSMVRAAESSGNLDRILTKLAESL